MVQWVITRHLIKISNFVQQLNIDNLEQELEIDQPAKTENELTQVVDAINSMRSELDRNVRLLKKSENRYRTLIKNAPIAILHLSLSGEILDLNPKAELLYGQNRDKIIIQDYIKNLSGKGSGQGCGGF